MITWPKLNLPPINLYSIGVRMSVKDQQIFLLESELDQYKDLLIEKNSQIADYAEEVGTLEDELYIHKQEIYNLKHGLEAVKV